MIMDENIFTKHVRAILAEKPDANDQILDHLERSLVGHLKKSRLWNAPPSYLGYDGETWNQSDALGDLAQDCYLYCILKPLNTIAQHLKFSNSIDGWVHWKIKHFLKDRQRKGNAIGMRVFANVAAASEALIDAKKVETKDSDKITGETTLLVVGKRRPNSLDELIALIGSDIENPEFAKSVCRKCLVSQRLIESMISAAIIRGLLGYQVGELVDLLTKKGREFFQSQGLDPATDGIEEFESEDLRTVTRMIFPEQRYEHSEDLEAKLRALLVHAESTIDNSRILMRVTKMLTFLADLIRQGEDIHQLKQAVIARQLGVSTSTFGEDIARLRESNLNLIQDSIEEGGQS